VENSRAAARAAMEAGYGIELDLQLTSCGEAVVFHDEALPRLTGAPGLLNDYSAEALAGIHLRGTDEGIPKLAEFLDLVDGRVPLLIEIKDQTGSLSPEVGPLEERVAECLKGYEGPVAVMSFNPHSVAALADMAPLVPRGLTSCAFENREWALPDYRRAELAGLADAERVGASFVSHDHRDLSNPALKRVKDAGFKIITWTIRSEEEEAAARAFADNITFEGYRAKQPLRQAP
jgi:glycerophosphoryl diester phosphodiesterase